jgi:CRISPR-associated protein Cmr2
MTYAAITIGPINDTIMLTSSPAGLWAASYIFSYISRRLCELILENGLVSENENILTPFYAGKDIKSDGIGRYSDRIVFKPDNAETVLKKIKEQFEEVAKDIATKAFYKDKNVEEPDVKGWFNQYLQLHAICVPVDNGKDAVSECWKYLDAIELEANFPTGVTIPNPLNELFESKNKNTQIREKIRDNFSDGKWPFQLKDEQYIDENGKERMPDMEDITGRRKETKMIEGAQNNKQPLPSRRKINSYYAIVKADGDRFGDYIKTHGESGKGEMNFSRKLFDFCSASADLVQNYGGVTIYAGGDDLLFMAPLTEKSEQASELTGKNEKPQNIFELLEKLREAFDKKFSGYCSPTISFGVAIRYYKYPLYEAFAEVNKLLNEEAKNKHNAAAISLQKHSGKDIRFILNDFRDTKLMNPIKKLIGQHINGEALSFVREKIWEFQPLFVEAMKIGDTELKNVFDNTFDSEFHRKHKKEIDDTRDLLNIISQLPSISKDLSKLSHEELELEMLDNILRFTKFWGEEGDDGDVQMAD